MRFHRVTGQDIAAIARLELHFPRQVLGPRAFVNDNGGPSFGALRNPSAGQEVVVSLCEQMLVRTRINLRQAGQQFPSTLPGKMHSAPRKRRE